MQETRVGISGMSVYVPALRVPLEAWCCWTGGDWGKVNAVVGRSFRCPAPHENVYTMAATAALRLIQAYGIDPRDVGYLALGTESSTDNAAGAVIVRGMLDRKLEALGMPRLSRSCEVPEFKHACLGGVYALKAALRYVGADGAGRKAIVVCGDIAEYERGTSGEPTQGAGAVAMLVEQNPRLVAIDLARSGSASDYRGPDFRKPMARFFVGANGHSNGHSNGTSNGAMARRGGWAPALGRLHDFPVFSGKYSTYAYLDETLHAFDDLVERTGRSAFELFDGIGAAFFHRPYRMMPLQAMAFLWARALVQGVARGVEHPAMPRTELEALCDRAGVKLGDAIAEAQSAADLYGSLLEAEDAKDPYPALGAIASQLRKSPLFADWTKRKMTLGADTSMDLGNLYTAALPAWLAAGLEQAAGRDEELGEILAVGYGSGDAAEALLLEPVDGWRSAARRIGVRQALEGAVDLKREQYEALHDGAEVVGLDYVPRDRFTIGRVGDRYEAGFQDLGVEYYEYVG